MLILLTILFLFPQRKVYQTTQYEGTYAWINERAILKDDPDVKPGGSVIVYPESDTSILFYLDILTSNYHTGTIYGRAYSTREPGKYLYDVKDGDYIDCGLAFSFNRKSLIISYLNERDRCGFGYGVFADHIYKKRKAVIPTYFINAEGDTVYFKETRPE